MWFSVERGRVGAPEELRAFLDSVSDFIGVPDHDWNMIYVNKPAAKAWGFLPQDLVGKNLWKTFPQSVGTAFGDILRDVEVKTQPPSFEHRAADLMHL